MKKFSTIAAAAMLVSTMNVFADAPKHGAACDKEKAACCKMKEEKKQECCKEASCDKQAADHGKCEKHDKTAKG